MTDLLERLGEAGVLSPLDRQFAGSLMRKLGPQPQAVSLGAALATRAVRNGHVCADLGRLHATPFVDRDARPLDIRLPDPGVWIGLLRSCAAVGDGEASTPLVLDHARLYLRRYYRYERRLAAQLRARAHDRDDVDVELLHDGLQRLFPAAAAAGLEPDPLQRQAAAIACLRSLTVLSGGPGTGKTTVVVKLLALLQEQALGANAPAQRVVLLAPTGKAAQRMSQAIADGRTGLDCSAAVRAAIPTAASTIHRALGWQPRTPTRFRHDRDNPLPADVVVVDESSMIDVALMTKLVEAVPAGARLVLIGDKDQLASVEAGAILGDIYNAEAQHRHTPELAARLLALTGVDPGPRDAGAQIELSLAAVAPEGPAMQDSMVHLTRSWRYAPTSGIAILARGVGSQDRDGVLAHLRNTGRGARHPEIRLIEPSPGHGLDIDLAAALDRGYSDYAKASGAHERLALLQRFRVLCAHRRGGRGVEQVNRLIERHLVARNLIDDDAQWYDGRPIIVTHNDYQLRLFNGDVGVICLDPETGRPWAQFHDEDGGLRKFAPARLPPHETVFAMTVHKSQGSEFDEVALILPEEPSPITTRELLYTAITRARRDLEIHSSEKVLAHAIAHAIERASGLREALWS